MTQDSYLVALANLRSEFSQANLSELIHSYVHKYNGSIGTAHSDILAESIFDALEANRVPVARQIIRI